MTRMDYKRIHDKLVELCRSTDPIIRLTSRNALDARLLSDSIYTEKHHVIPKHEGGSDDPDNILVVLPEEHLMLHLLRWRFTETHLNLYAAKMMMDQSKTCKEYALVRQSYSLSFRGKNHPRTGKTHSPRVKQILSDFRKGTFYAKDANTGKKLGMISTDDPRVLQGTAVHVSKGLTNPNKGNDQNGSRNSNWSGYSDEEIAYHAYKCFVNNNREWSRNVWFKYCEATSPPLPKHYTQQMRFSKYSGSSTSRFKQAVTEYAIRTQMTQY